MKSLKIFLFTLLFLGFGISGAWALSIGLYEYAFNIDGIISGPLDPDPPEADISGFDLTTGLGFISVEIFGTGTHYVGLFVDHEIDQPVNTYYNEFGSTSGFLSPGQSWEIDEPGWGGPISSYEGDIYYNMQASSLDKQYLENLDGTSGSAPEDISMAIGWDFDLDPLDAFATINFSIRETKPTSGFYLTHTDPKSDASIYFSSTFDKTPIPEPGTILLVSTGLAGLIGLTRKRFKKK